MVRLCHELHGIELPSLLAASLALVAMDAHLGWQFPIGTGFSLPLLCAFPVLMMANCALGVPFASVRLRMSHVKEGLLNATAMLFTLGLLTSYIFFQHTGLAGDAGVLALLAAIGAIDLILFARLYLKYHRGTYPAAQRSQPIRVGMQPRQPAQQREVAQAMS